MKVVHEELAYSTSKKDIPEKVRIALREAASNIGDMLTIYYADMKQKKLKPLPQKKTISQLYYR